MLVVEGSGSEISLGTLQSIETGAIRKDTGQIERNSC